MEEQILITPAGLLEILLQIDELKDLDMNMVTTIDGKIQLQIGDSTYGIDPSDVEPTMEADEEAIDFVEEVNELTYTNLVESNEITDEDIDVSSGIIKDFIKTLALGGAIKLAKSLLK